MSDRVSTFGEWVDLLEEGKKGVIPDFISEKLKGKKDGKDKDKKGVPAFLKGKKDSDDDDKDDDDKDDLHNDGVKKKHRSPVDKGKKEKDRGQKTGEGKREKE